MAVKLARAIGTYQLAVKRMRFSPPVRITLYALPALLGVIKSFLVYYRLLGVLEYLLVFLCYIVAFLVLKVLSCLEIDRMPEILLFGKYARYRRTSPAVRVFYFP